MNKAKRVRRQSRTMTTQEGESERFADVLKTVRQERARRERTRVRSFSLQEVRTAK